LGRQKLRSIEIPKFRAQSGLSKQTSGLKTGPIILKAGSVLKKSPAEAMDLAEEALAIDPFSPKANEILAQAAAALDLPKVAALAYETICEGKPDNTEPFQKLADLYVQQKEWEKAQNAYERLLQINPRDGDAMSAMKNVTAQIASLRGGWEKKGGDFRDSLKDKGQAEALEQAGKIVKTEDAIQAQIAQLSAKVQAEPGNLTWPKQVGALYVQLAEHDTDGKYYDSAIEWYQYTFDLGNKMDSSLEKTISELRLKKLDKNILLYKDAAATDPAQYQEYYDTLVVQRKQVVLEMAQHRVERYPTEFEFHFQLGKAYVDLEMYKEALQPLQNGAKSPAVRTDALNLIGYCQWKRKMLDMAEKTFTNVANEIPVMNELKKDILYNLGLVLEESGKKELYIEKMKEIYEVDMSYKDVAQRVEASYG
jgi:tetratricopeptide (TPR) repeat protein